MAHRALKLAGNICHALTRVAIMTSWVNCIISEFYVFEGVKSNIL